jgi:hypothetical protein
MKFLYVPNLIMSASWQFTKTPYVRKGIFLNSPFLGTHYLRCLPYTLLHIFILSKWFWFLCNYLWHNETCLCCFIYFSCNSNYTQLPLQTTLQFLHPSLASSQKHQIYLKEVQQWRRNCTLFEADATLLQIRRTILPWTTLNTTSFICPTECTTRLL